MTIFAGTIAGGAAAHSHGGALATISFTAGGFAVGLGFALASTKLAYAVLDRAIRRAGERETAAASRLLFYTS